MYRDQSHQAPRRGLHFSITLSSEHTPAPTSSGSVGLEPGRQCRHFQSHPPRPAMIEDHWGELVRTSGNHDTSRFCPHYGKRFPTQPTLVHTRALRGTITAPSDGCRPRQAICPRLAWHRKPCSESTWGRGDLPEGPHAAPESLDLACHAPTWEDIPWHG